VVAELLYFSLALAVLATAGLVVLPARWRRGREGDEAATVAVLIAACLGTAALTGDAAGAVAFLVVASLACALVHQLARDWELLGCAMFAGVAGSAAAYLTYVGWMTYASQLPLIGVVASTLLLALELSALLLTASYAHELVDVLARRRWHALGAHELPAKPPRVCIQVPTYNEPVELVVATLDAIAAIDYPNFMVQLVDNNTADPALWRPVEEHCRKLGRRFHFIHLENWPGYKSGALNEATRRLPKNVEIVAVVDADYIVEPTFLAETVAQFTEPDVAFVQTPQHYREWADDSYLSHCFYAYKYFFDVTMPSRNQRNAIIFGGTMGLVRRSVLDAVGGWDEWCITEDAEASLRILAQGYRGVFINKPYGHGLMPLSFDGLKKQRFRWAFGGIQILKKHWRLMLTGRLPDGTKSKLTRAQRYHYFAGSVQWFNELLTVAFTTLLVVSSVVILLGRHLPMRQLTGAVLVIPLVFLFMGLFRLVWALRVRSGASLRQAVGAVGVLFSLSWVVAEACVTALVRRRGVFLRTPKARSSSSLIRSVTSTRTESLLAAGTVALGGAILGTHLSAVTITLGVLLVLQGLIYVNSPVNALRAEGIRVTALRRTFRQSPQTTGQRPVTGARRARNFAIATALALIASGFIAAVATAPAGGSLLSPGSLLPQVGGIVGTVPRTSPSPSASASAAASAAASANASARAGATPTPRAGPTVGTSPVAVPSVTVSATATATGPTPRSTNAASPSPRTTHTPSPAGTSHPTPAPSHP